MTKPETRRALFRTASASFIAAAVASAVPREAFAAVERDPRYADPKSLIVINPAFAIHPGHVHAIEIIDIPYEGYETGRMSWLKLHAHGQEIDTELMTPAETWALAKRILVEATNPYPPPHNTTWEKPLIYAYPNLLWHTTRGYTREGERYDNFLFASAKAKAMRDQLLSDWS